MPYKHKIVGALPTSSTNLKLINMFEEDNLLTPMSEPINNIVGTQFFISFINQLEGWKTKCKNLHWSAPKQNIHIYLDEFLEVLSDYQDGLAEGIMGITGKIAPNAIKGTSCDCLDAFCFIKEVKEKTIMFYDRIPKETIYKGVVSECETFIQNINKFDYLFHLCDVKTY